MRRYDLRSRTPYMAPSSADLPRRRRQRPLRAGTPIWILFIALSNPGLCADRLTVCYERKRIGFYLLVAESHLPARVPGDVHPAQEEPVFAVCWSSAQLCLYALMVLFVYYVVDAIAVDQQVLLCYTKRNNVIALVQFSNYINTAIGWIMYACDLRFHVKNHRVHI